ncbi:DUF6114 domain-containing protein [Paractinoplanes durhamensis]|uniref:Uncharacterized protein n=1 Tax=Paractinoplanes durhamensis TaxID=113563 RepID=A0ABQ3YZM1_9ACTN|nr:DUF6114 domain-containing protein [Actinoplanes durhamensis]GIE03030.1 hypothetical protein Adu01nite_43800 [Actinoplanes durhamensis]
MFLTAFTDAAARLDERLPARRPRRAFRTWRRTRPFWGGIATIAGGATILSVPLAPLPIMIHVGTAAISGFAIGAILVAAGLFFWFAPAQRAFIAVLSTICALVSVVTSNLGGLGFGALLALLGSAMSFGWHPHRPRPIVVELPDDDIDDESATRITEALYAASGPPRSTTTTTAAVDGPRHAADRRESPGPDPNRSQWPLWSDWFRRSHAFVLIPVMLAAVAMPAEARNSVPAEARNSVPGEAPDAAAAAAPAAVPTCVPVPGATRPWWIPEWLWLICPNPSATPSPTAGGTIPPSPTPTPPDSSGPKPTPGPTPGGPSGPGDPSTSGSADPSTGGSGAPTVTPTPGVTPSAGAGLTPAPAMAAPGKITEIKYGPNVPTVSADRLFAKGFTFKGTVNLPTGDGGSVKALIFHADNLKADNYRIGTTDPGPKLDLGIDLDIDDVDIYATHLGGKITVPYLNIPLLPIEITADLIPTWLPLEISLPLFSGDGVKAGQVFIRAGTVRGSSLSADINGAGQD